MLGTKKWEFVEKAPQQWVLAMLLANNKIPKHDDMVTLFKTKKYGGQIPLYDRIMDYSYDTLYRDALKELQRKR